MKDQPDNLNDPKLILATAFWCQYYVECEIFDKKVCSIKSPDGTPMPATRIEANKIDSFAKNMAQRVKGQSKEYSIDEKTLEIANKIAMHYSFDRQQKEIWMIPDYKYTLSL